MKYIYITPESYYYSVIAVGSTCFLACFYIQLILFINLQSVSWADAFLIFVIVPIFFAFSFYFSRFISSLLFVYSVIKTDYQVLKNCDNEMRCKSLSAALFYDKLIIIIFKIIKLDTALLSNLREVRNNYCCLASGGKAINNKWKE